MGVGLYLAHATVQRLGGTLSISNREQGGTMTRITLPLLAPGIVAGAMLAFTLSLDDFVISFFTAGPESVTLPLFIFAAVRRGVTPQIHALSTLVVLITVVMIIGMERFTRR